MTSPMKSLSICSAIILSGALQTLCYSPFDWWIVGPLSLGLLLLATGALKPSAHGKPALYGWLYGLGLFGAGVSWVYVSINTYGNASPVLAGFLTVLFVAGLSLFTALQFSLFYRLRGPSVSLNALLFVAVWVLADGFRSFFLTGFPWLFLGYSHLTSPLSGWAPVVGVYGLSALSVVTATALCLSYYYLRNKALLSRPVLIVNISAISLIWLAGPALKNIQWTQPEGTPLSVSLIQSNIPQEKKWLPEQRRATLELLERLSAEHWDKDLIIWPETAVPLLLDQALPWLEQVDQAASSSGTNIITGIPYRELDQQGQRFILHNSIYSFGDGSGLYHKQKLVPFGEYVPLQGLLRGLIDFFDLPMSDFRPGPQQQAQLRSKHLSVAPFICYEVVYPDFVAEHARHADYLLTISNDAWFGRSIGPLQHLQMAQMRALENGRYMVRGTNNGITAMINQKGEITAQAPQFVETVLSTEVQAYSGRTLFNQTGSMPLFLLAGLISALICWHARSNAN